MLLILLANVSNIILETYALKIEYDVYATSKLWVGVGGVKARLNDLLAKASIIQY